MRVTALIPCHNGAAFLPASIASIRAQTRPVDEILVVDDASTDNSVAVAEAEGARVLRLERNAGPSEARNRGIASAQGDVIAFLDADDLWLPEHCSLVLPALDRHPDVVLSAARVVIFGDGPDVPSVPRGVPEGVPYDAAPFLLQRNVVAQTAAAVRRDAVQQAGGYDPALRLSEDYDLWMRLARVGRFVHVPAFTARYRVHPGQATRALGPLLLSAWNNRLREYNILVAAGEISRDDLDQALRDAYETDFRDTWYAGQRSAFDAMFAVADGLPWLRDVAARWRRRASLGWYAWHAARRIKRLATRR